MPGKLVAFYSRAGENYFDGDYRYLETGNTERAASMVAEAAGADLLKIEQAEPYAEDYRTCIEQAKRDLESGARPRLASLPHDLDGYAEVYLGYPNYWGNMPMAVYAFLEAFDWDGKTIHPFCTHEGSGLARSVDGIAAAAPGARVTEGLAIVGSRVDMARGEIERWV